MIDKFNCATTAYKSGLCNLRNKRVGNRYDGDDLCQEALIVLHKLCQDYPLIDAMKLFGSSLKFIPISIARKQQEDCRDYRIETTENTLSYLTVENLDIHRFEFVDAFTYAFSRFSPEARRTFVVLSHHSNTVLRKNGLNITRLTKELGITKGEVKKHLAEIHKKFETAFRGDLIPRS